MVIENARLPKPEVGKSRTAGCERGVRQDSSGFCSELPGPTALFYFVQQQDFLRGCEAGSSVGSERRRHIPSITREVNDGEKLKMRDSAHIACARYHERERWGRERKEGKEKKGERGEKETD